MPDSLDHSVVALMCERARRLLESAPAQRLICDVTRVRRPDMAAIEALARLCLTAQRLGCRVELRGACAELRDLLELTGLADVVACQDPPPSGLSVETRGQSEQRKEPGGVQEERDPRDAAP